MLCVQVYCIYFVIPVGKVYTHVLTFVTYVVTIHLLRNIMPGSIVVKKHGQLHLCSILGIYFVQGTAHKYETRTLLATYTRVHT